MVWKTVDKNSPGVAGTTFGSDDIDKISDLFNGVADVDTVDINSIFGIRHGKGRITNSAGANPIVLNSAATQARTITFPDSDGTLALQGEGSFNASTAQDVLLYPESAGRYGGWQGGQISQGFGWAQNLHNFSGGSTILTAVDGKAIRFTATTTGTPHGIKTTLGAGVVRSIDPWFRCKFRLNTLTTGLRLNIGLHSNGTANAYLTGDDPLSGLSGVVLSVISTDANNFRIRHNDGDGAGTTVAVNTGVSYTAAATTHIIEIRGTDAGTWGQTANSWAWRIDGGSWSTPITADIPASGTGLYPAIQIDTADATSRNFDMWWWMCKVNG